MAAIFVPFGGHFGDCGDYHGAVVAVGVDPPRLLGAWITRARKGGIWAPAGLSEADGSLYFSTGNTAGARDWQDGEGVFRVGPDLAHSSTPMRFSPHPTGNNSTTAISILVGSRHCP